MPDPFTGFPPEGVTFLAGLAETNTKTYFDAHRATYQHALARPVRALVDDVGARLRAEIAPDLCFEPTAGKSLFRINRDTRFTTDKTPYNPWIDAIWWPGHDNARQAPAFIYRLAADHLVVGAGVMGLRDNQVDRYRSAVADDDTGTTHVTILARLRGGLPELEITEPSRKRVPSPHPPDHPRGDLLRCDSLHASVRRPHPPSLHEAAFAETLTELLTPFARLHRWLVDHTAS